MLTKDPAQRLTLPQIMSHPWVTHNGKAPMACLQVLALPVPWTVSELKLIMNRLSQSCAIVTQEASACRGSNSHPK